MFISSKNLKTQKFSEVLSKNGVLNFAFTFEDEKGEIRVEISNHFSNTSQTLKNISKSQIISLLYPNKIKDMHKKMIRVFAHALMPNIYVMNDQICSINKYLIKTISGKLNASYDIKLGRTANTFAAQSEAKNLFENNQADMTLGLIYPLTDSQKLVSYHENGICILIPLQPASYHHSLFVLETFEWNSICLIVFTLIFVMVLWRIYKSLGVAFGSSWNVAFGLISSFLGQSFNFRTTNSIMFFVIMQSVFVGIILNNLYQGEKNLFKKINLLSL